MSYMQQMGSGLQSLYIAPREEEDPRFAQTDHTRLSVGGDGVLYKMLDSRDWNRYHVLSDHEMENEVRRSREVKENMYTLMGKLKNGQYTNRSRGPKFVAPQLGTASRSKKIDQRAWEKDLGLAMSGEATTRGHSNSSYNKTIASLIDNTRELEEEEEDPASPVFDYRSQQPGQDKVAKAFHVIKTKYEQNLHVVDKLYHEKMSLEDYAKSLEEELMRTKGVDSPSELQHMMRASRQRAALDEDYDVDDGEEDPHQREAMRRSMMRGPKGSNYDPLYEGGGEKENRRNLDGGSYSAEDIASMLHPGDSHANRRLGRSVDRGNHAIRSSSAPRNMTRKSVGGDFNATAPARATSAGRSRSGSRPRGEGLSASLQADCDRFVQKRKLMDERDRLAKLEQEKYELELQEKKLRASRNSKDFTEMFQRQEQAKAKQQKRMEEEKLKEREQELKMKKEKHKKQIEKMTLMHEAFRGHMSWKEIQDTEEAQRRERIEKRKNELLTQAALPRSIEENMSKSLSKIPPPSYDEAIKPFKAEDPKKVIQKIERRHQEWQETMMQQKLKIKEQHEAAKMSGNGSLGSTNKTTMELRFEEHQKKREERTKRQQEKEAAEKHKKDAEEKRKREKLLNMKFPEASKKTTKKAEEQAQLVRDKQIKEEEEAKKLRDKMRKKDLAMKETSAALSVVIKEEEQRLKSNNPNYLELSKSEHIAEEKAKQAREEYRQKLRDNKMRLKESLKSRPSLIERHEKNIATRDASTAALRKVATAVLSVGGREEGKNDYGDDDDDDDEPVTGRSKRTTGSHGKGGEDFLDEIFNPVQKMSLGRKA